MPHAPPVVPLLLCGGVRLLKAFPDQAAVTCIHHITLMISVKLNGSAPRIRTWTKRVRVSRAANYTNAERRAASGIRTHTVCLEGSHADPIEHYSREIQLSCLGGRIRTCDFPAP